MPGEPGPGHYACAVVGIAERMRGCLFDVEGVLTKSAKVHAAAWKEMFDDFLRERARQTGEPNAAFDPVTDYDEYVDGKPRADGTRSFLASRGIELPEGQPDDPPDALTVHGLGNRKNEIVLRRIREDGVEAYPGSVRYVQAVQAAGLPRAGGASSANCRDVLVAAGSQDRFGGRVDRAAAVEVHLANGHVGWRGSVEEGERHGLPGSYLNGVYESRPLPYAESAYGLPETGQEIINVTNGKLIRMFVDDEPFDVRYGQLRAHERPLDFRAAVLNRRADWVSPARRSVRVSSTRLVSFTQRAIAAICYEVEPLDGPARIAVQSELLAHAQLPATGAHP